MTKKLSASELIRNRRSMYPGSYSEETVPEEIINEILENANWAPTHKLTQPWRFVVFTGEGLKTLAKKQADVYKESTELSGTFDQGVYDMLLSKPLKASHVIAIIMKRDNQERVPEIEEIASVSAAVQNMYLTACYYELGCYWGTSGITYFKKTHQLFNLEENDRFMGFFFIGKLNREYPEGKRDSIEDKVQWVKE